MSLSAKWKPLWRRSSQESRPFARLIGLMNWPVICWRGSTSSLIFPLPHPPNHSASIEALAVLVSYNDLIFNLLGSLRKCSEDRSYMRHNWLKVHNSSKTEVGKLLKNFPP